MLETPIILAAGPAVRVTFDYCDDAPAALCDGNALDDAVMNLVVNAIRAMPTGGALSIALLRDSRGLDGLPALQVRVADTGCGMDEATLVRAFVPGFTTKGLGRSGSGLGLAVVDDFVRSAGGLIDVESKIGVGTVVSLRLPAMLKSARAGSSES